VDDCATRPCQNGGTCHDLINSFRCSCPPGTKGLLCEIDDDDCVSGPCVNGGTCVDRVGRYECVCPAGFAGDRCEADVNECLSGRDMCLF